MYLNSEAFLSHSCPARIEVSLPIRSSPCFLHRFATRIRTSHVPQAPDSSPLGPVKLLRPWHPFRKSSVSSPGHLTSRLARRVCADARRGIPASDSRSCLHGERFGQRHGDGSDGCQRDGVERGWDYW